MHFAVQKDVFLALKYGNTRWRPDPIPLSAFGASILAPSALDTGRLWRLEFRAYFGVPIVVNLRNDHWSLVGSRGNALIFNILGRRVTIIWSAKSDAILSVIVVFT